MLVDHIDQMTGIERESRAIALRQQIRDAVVQHDAAQQAAREAECCRAFDLARAEFEMEAGPTLGHALVAAHRHAQLSAPPATPDPASLPRGLGQSRPVRKPDDLASVVASLRAFHASKGPN